jgi:hypothetical protein
MKPYFLIASYLAYSWVTAVAVFRCCVVVPVEPYRGLRAQDLEFVPLFSLTFFVYVLRSS